MKVSTLFATPAPNPPADLTPPPPPESGPLALFSPAAANTFGMMQRGLDALEEQLQAITVHTQDDCNGVARGLAEVKRALKTCEGTRKGQTKPLRDKESAINNTWRGLTDRLTTLATRAERKIMGWNEAERLRRFREEEAARKAAEEAIRKAEEVRAKAEADGKAEAMEAAQAAEVAAQAEMAEAKSKLAAVEQAPRGIRTESGTTSSLWKWTFSIVDAAVIPRSFLIPDEAAIRNAVNCGLRDIPGVAIYQEETLRTVTR